MSGHSRVRVSRAYEIISLRDGLKRWHMTKKVFAVRVDCCDSATTFIIGGSSHEKAEKVLVRVSEVARWSHVHTCFTFCSCGNRPQFGPNSVFAVKGCTLVCFGCTVLFS